MRRLLPRRSARPAPRCEAGGCPEDFALDCLPQREIDSTAAVRYHVRMTETVARPNNTAALLFLAGAVIALSHLANEWVKLEQPWGPAWKAAGIVVLGLYALS